jgi:hypothetical protein
MKKRLRRIYILLAIALTSWTGTIATIQGFAQHDPVLVLIGAANLVLSIILVQRG